VCVCVCVYVCVCVCTWVLETKLKTVSVLGRNPTWNVVDRWSLYHAVQPVHDTDGVEDQNIALHTVSNVSALVHLVHLLYNSHYYRGLFEKCLPDFISISLQVGHTMWPLRGHRCSGQDS
jgi:hypothetical protein